MPARKIQGVRGIYHSPETAVPVKARQAAALRIAFTGGAWYDTAKTGGAPRTARTQREREGMRGMRIKRLFAKLKRMTARSYVLAILGIVAAYALA